MYGYNGSYNGGYGYNPPTGYNQPTGYYGGNGTSENLDQLRRQQQQIQQQPIMQPTQNIQFANVPNTDDNGITWVQGEEGAKAYLVAPGKKKLLLDSEIQYFYLKETDMSGMPMPMRRFRYIEETVQEAKTPLQTPQNPASDFITREEFAALEARFNELVAMRTAEPKKEAKKTASKEEVNTNG